MNVSGWKRKLIWYIRAGGSEFILTNFKGKEWPWFKLLVHSSSKEKGVCLKIHPSFFDPAMELKDKTHHNKMDVDLKNVYSGKHDFIRDREEEGKRKHTEHSGSENQDYFLLAQTQQRDYEKTRIRCNSLFLIHVCGYCISYFNDLRQIEFSISFSNPMTSPCPRPKWVCTVNKAGFHQEHQGILLRPQGPGVPA